MMVELWSRERDMGDENQNDVEDTSGFGNQEVQLA